jgi:hypothetical protein
MKLGYFLLLLLISGCAQYPLATRDESEKNLMNMTQVTEGMKMREVKKIMGMPYKVEKRKMEGKKYTTWFYLTKRTKSYQTKILEENLTPFVFYRGILKGIGYFFYNELFDINNARMKRDAELRQEYTDDREEWPPNEHKIISPEEKYPSDEDREDAIEKFLKESIQPKEEIEIEREKLLQEDAVKQPYPQVDEEKPIEKQDMKKTPSLEKPSKEKQKPIENQTQDQIQDQIQKFLEEKTDEK